MRAFRPIVDRFLQGRAGGHPAGGIRGRGQERATRKTSAPLAETDGRSRPPGSVVEITERGLQKDIWEVRKAGLNIMMSMKGDGKPVSFIEDCAVPLEHLAEYTDRLTKVFREARHPRHVVCACVGGNAACAPDSRHAARWRREDARDRRGSLRDGQGIQRRLFRRTRRRPGALGVDRADSREPTERGAGADQGPVRSEGPDESGQDRAAVANGRSLPVPLQARLPDEQARHGARLVGVGRLRSGGGDVQQQWPLPQVRRRHHVPVVSRHGR